MLAIAGTSAERSAGICGLFHVATWLSHCLAAMIQSEYSTRESQEDKVEAALTFMT